MREAYENIVGIINDSAEPDDIKTSLSGSFMDEIEIIDTLLKSGEDGVTLVKKSRDTAIKQFVGDTNLLLINNRNQSFKTYNGIVGQSRNVGDLDPLGTMIGVRVTLRPINGGMAQLNGVGIHSDKDETIYVYDQYGNELGSQLIPYTAGTPKPVTLTTPISIEVDGDEPTEVFIVCTPVGNIKQNKINCECGRFTPSYSKVNPYYFGKHYGSDNWANYAMIGGIEMDSPDDIYNISDDAINRMNGLILDLKFGCNVSAVMENHITDFESDPLAVAIALAIMYKTAELSVDGMIQSNDVNLQILVNPENIIEIQDKWIEAYKEKITYVSENANVEVNECLCKKDAFGLSNQTLYS